MNIMIIDDEYYARKDIYSLLKKYSNDTCIYDFEEPEMALDYLVNNSIDIIFSDIRMPGKNGLEIFEDINKLYPWIYLVVVSGYSDFEYAQQAIKVGVKAFLLKPVDEKVFLEELSKAVLYVNQKQVEKIRKDTIVRKEILLNKSIVERKLHLFLYEGSDKSFNSISSEIPSWNNGEYCLGIVKTDNRLTAEILDRTRKILDNILEYSGYFLISGRNSHEFILLLFNKTCNSQLRDLKKLRVVELLKSLIIRGNESIDSNYYIAVCSDNLEQSGLQERFAKTQNIMDMRFYFPENSVIEIDDIESSLINRDEITNQKMVVVEDLLIRACWKETVCELNEIFEDIKENGISSLYNMQSIYRHTCSVIIKVLWRNDIELIDDADEIMKRLSQIGNYFNLQPLLDDIISLLDAVAKADSIKVNNDDMTNDLLKYLDRNYDIDICLSELAPKRYNVSAEHLNRKFKKKAGRNISVYLKELRIRKAKELLVDFSLSVTDVAGIVGFNDISYFIQTFKKVIGETPGEFRHKVHEVENI